MWYHMMHHLCRWSLEEKVTSLCWKPLSSEDIPKCNRDHLLDNHILETPPTVPQIFWSAMKKMNTKQVLMVCVPLGSIRSARLILTFFFLSKLKHFGRIIFRRSAISEIICCFGFCNLHICEKWKYSVLFNAKKWGSAGNRKYNL